MAQRVVQYQAVLQMAQSAPQIYDLPQLHRQMIEVLGVKNAEKLVPTEDDIRPTDPVSENMNALNGKPMKAFIYQDHDAHMAAHQAFLQDPMVAATGQTAGEAHRGISTGSHCRAPWLQVPQADGRKAGRTATQPECRTARGYGSQLSSLDATAGAQVTQRTSSSGSTSCPEEGSRPCGADAAGRATDQAARSAA